MTAYGTIKIDPKLDLVLERVVEVPREKLWKGWTQPELLKKWFCPLPWKTVEAEIDLRPGGRFYTVMQSPEGDKFPNVGCYLEVVPNEKLVWTGALDPSYRPKPAAQDGPDMPFSAAIILEPHAKGTKYVAIALHRDEEGRKQHEQMGFKEGWGAALDQLVALTKTM